MTVVSFLSITDQVAQHLRSEILRGRWRNVIPGKHELAADLGVNNKTVEGALRLLENDGILISQGPGRARRINPAGGEISRALRVGFLLNEGERELQMGYQVELNHALTAAGHSVMYLPQSLTELRFDIKKIGALVRQSEADAWIVCAGSREVLEWFSQQNTPAFAMFGHRVGVKIASVGPDKLPAFTEATRQLIALGHHRISLLCRRLRRLPEPGASESAFLATLASHGIAHGEYNLPDWDDTNEGFHQCLEALFRVTPPTALIIEEASYFVAAMQFLVRRGIRVPQDVSLISTDDDVVFSHCDPPIACVAWDTRPLVRRIVHWAANISRGKVDKRLTMTPAVFKSGGTIGPAKT